MRLLAIGPNRELLAALDDRLQGWIISPEALDICTRADGSAWLLGSGSFGKVTNTALPSRRVILILLCHPVV